MAKFSSLKLIDRCTLLNTIIDKCIIKGNKLIGKQFYRFMRCTSTQKRAHRMHFTIAVSASKYIKQRLSLKPLKENLSFTKDTYIS